MRTRTNSGACGLFSRLSRGKENWVPDERSRRAVDRHGARRHRSSIRRQVWQPFSGFTVSSHPIPPSNNVKVPANGNAGHSDELIHWCAPPQDGRAGSQPHPGRKGGPLVLQPARQKLQRGHWEEGDQTLQTLSAQEIQAKEVCEEVCGVLRHQQRQGHLSAGADGLPGRDQRRRWPE